MYVDQKQSIEEYEENVDNNTSKSEQKTLQPNQSANFNITTKSGTEVQQQMTLAKKEVVKGLNAEQMEQV